MGGIEIKAAPKDPSRVPWIKLPTGHWFAEGPEATELLLGPTEDGRWSWQVSQHTVTAFVYRAGGVCADRCEATLAAEAVALHWALR